jgi:glucose-6-phosphate dehydrogenase assembly protein OpcA
MTTAIPDVTATLPRRRFEFERRIPLALLFGFLLQTGGALFWAGAAAERIAQVERETRANSGAIERVVRLEAEVAAMHEALARIESKLDRAIAPSGSGLRTQ